MERPYQEIALYFLIEFAPGSAVLDRDGPFEGSESGTSFQWIPWTRWNKPTSSRPFSKRV